MTRDELLRRALQLSALSVGFSGLVGLLAVGVGLATGRVALLGFGFDAAVDSVASVVLLWRFRLERTEPHRADRAEAIAERIVGVVLVVLALYVTVTALQALATSAHPKVTEIGVVIPVVSLLVLPPLALAKRRVADALQSGALLADSSLTGLAAILAAISLLSLAVTVWLGIVGADAVGGLVVAGVMAREGLRPLRP